MKITSMVIGSTIISRRLRALLALVFAGPIDVVAFRQFHLPVHLAMASSTVLPRSRPRTLYLMAT